MRMFLLGVALIIFGCSLPERSEPKVSDVANVTSRMAHVLDETERYDYAEHAYKESISQQRTLRQVAFVNSNIDLEEMSKLLRRNLNKILKSLDIHHHVKNHKVYLYTNEETTHTCKFNFNPGRLQNIPD